MIVVVHHLNKIENGLKREDTLLLVGCGRVECRRTKLGAADAEA